jgi:prophage antirepressor-like protein
MNELQIFKNEQFGQIRVIEKDGQPWFVGKDVAEILQYKEPHKAIVRHVDEEDRTKHPILTNGGEQEGWIINESGLYALILSSEMKEAKKFKRWVTSEVLPTIRKTGGYVANDEMFINTYLPFADDTVKAMFKSTLETVRAQNELIRKQQKEIQHKEDVIIGLVDKVELAEKRQILNRVVRYKGANFQTRWRELYKQFEMKYHIDLNKRFETYNATNTPKLKNKIDYIDKVMNKIPELYEIACKLYEADVKELAQSLYSLN